MVCELYVSEAVRERKGVMIQSPVFQNAFICYKLKRKGLPWWRSD